MIAHAAAGTKNGVHAQRGFTLVSAVFLIVVLASLSAYLVNLRLYQEASGTLDTLGTRAYAAARSGVEWAAYNSLRTGTCTSSPSLVLGGTLSGFTVTVTCNTVGPYDEAGVSVNVDTIVATACNSATCPPATPGTNYVERQITVMVSR
jgi:MSHA biogenesis protein MshP